MKGNMNLVKFLEDAGLLIGVTERIKNKKITKDGFLGMLSGTLEASLLGNMLESNRLVRVDDEVIQAKDGSRQDFLIKPHPYINFEIEKYYQKKTNFKGVYLQNNLRNTVKGKSCIVNLDERKSIGNTLDGTACECY